MQEAVWDATQLLTTERSCSGSSDTTKASVHLGLSFLKPGHPLGWNRSQSAGEKVVSKEYGERLQSGAGPVMASFIYHVA